MSLIRRLDTRLNRISSRLRHWHEFAFGWRRLGIRPTDLVLEIGSGQKPMPRSDVLCDKFFGDGTERGGEALIVDRPVVIGDAQRLPFKDKAFDFAYTSHLIEHVDRPELFCAELMRVAKRGFITCPSEYAEKFVGWGVHRWFVRVDGRTLVLTQKERPIHDMTLSAFAHNPRHLVDGAPLARFIAAYGDVFWIAFSWEDTFEYEVHRAPHREATGWTVSTVDESPAAGSTRVPFKRRMASWWSRGVRALHSRRGPLTLTDLLACPVCRSGVSAVNAQTLRCSSCGRDYPVSDGMPYLVADETICAESAAS